MILINYINHISKIQNKFKVISWERKANYTVSEGGKLCKHSYDRKRTVSSRWVSRATWKRAKASFALHRATWAPMTWRGGTPGTVFIPPNALLGGEVQTQRCVTCAQPTFEPLPTDSVHSHPFWIHAFRECLETTGNQELVRTCWLLTELQ